MLLDANGALGGGDTLKALVDAEPDGNKFDLDLDYRAPKGGLLATLTGTEARLTRADRRRRHLEDVERLRSSSPRTGRTSPRFQLRNRQGTYRIVGQARPAGYLTGLPSAALGDGRRRWPRSARSRTAWSTAASRCAGAA